MNKRQQQSVPYDVIASTYDQRYVYRAYEGIYDTLRSLISNLRAEKILEVGCGTGHWLSQLQNGDRWVYGLDISLGMLQEARKKSSNFNLTCGRARHLPYLSSSFDLLFCVNAFHHFAHPKRFIEEARRLLKPGGALGIIGMDPHTGRDRWYIYDYFEGTHEIDLKRFPSGGTIVDWMASAGMNSIERRVVERLVNEYSVHSVPDDPFLQKNCTSQLILLDEDAYAAGLHRIEADFEEAGSQGRQLRLPIDVSLFLVCGYV